VLFLNT